ncbi:MAG: MXAN_5187 C-terminal domain-containing protein [Acidobacteriota bacterium]
MANPTEFEEKLELFEESLRKLKIQYDMFFTGARRVPPSFERGRLESLVHEMSRVKLRELSLRFRFNTLTARFNQYRELWSRRSREAEEGPLDYRKRVVALESPVSEIKNTRAPVTSPAADSYVSVTGKADQEAIVQLHGLISEARKDAGAAALSIDQVSEMVRVQAEKLRNRYGVEEIAFRVQIVEGKVKLKARPIREKL